ncbi:MAG TPA: SRPBCC domain-containing protein [Puia sp.]|uniref:SRPBCC family protein n=1 Tax=Puia sp. TaxID=2045100 RepID=UPI002CCFC9DE|nr:SRPBCC domain-containing protein [Puia sp.]HVU95285.1 SRPBCC domain-containing protein [Puia sp.]
MANKNFTYSFETGKRPEEVFGLLLQIPQWWSGLYEETIEGKSEKVNDSFSFAAGGGAHYTEQKVVELVPGKKVTWLVTKANLSFLDQPEEWEGTRFGFTVSDGKKTVVTFVHEGLVPEVECYEACSMGWTGYLQRLEKRLN